MNTDTSEFVFSGTTRRHLVENERSTVETFVMTIAGATVSSGRGDQAYSFTDVSRMGPALVFERPVVVDRDAAGQFDAAAYLAGNSSVLLLGGPSPIDIRRVSAMPESDFDAILASVGTRSASRKISHIRAYLAERSEDEIFAFEMAVTTRLHDLDSSAAVVMLGNDILEEDSLAYRCNVILSSEAPIAGNVPGSSAAIDLDGLGLLTVASEAFTMRTGRANIYLDSGIEVETGANLEHWAVEPAQRERALVDMPRFEALTGVSFEAWGDQVPVWDAAARRSANWISARVVSVVDNSFFERIYFAGLEWGLRPQAVRKAFLDHFASNQINFAGSALELLDTHIERPFGNVTVYEIERMSRVRSVRGAKNQPSPPR